MNNEIIEVKQLPVIAEQLEKIKAEVAHKVAIATSLVCTDDTVKEVKKSRAALRAEFGEWENKRQAVKHAIMAPYDKFESAYKDCITDTYKAADKDLKIKIDSVESELKSKKENEVREYFSEYLASKEIEFVKFEDADINITLSASIKSLKSKAKDFIDKICDDLNLIETQEHSVEILVEYKNTLNVSAAITSVMSRIKAIEEQKAKQESIESHREELKKHDEEIKAMTATLPIVEPEEETVYTVTFKVTDTMPRLKQMKLLLDERGYKYE